MYHTSKRRTDPLFRESQGKGLRVERSGFYFRSWHRQGFTSCAQALPFVAELYLCRYYMCFLLKFYNWCKYTDLCCLLVRYSNVFLNNIEIFFSTEVYGGPEVVGFPVLTVFGFSSHMVMSSKGWGGRRRHGGVTDASACQWAALPLWGGFYEQGSIIYEEDISFEY